MQMNSTIMRNIRLGYEDLEVWKRAVDFAVKVIKLVETIETNRKHFCLLEQIKSSSTSVSMNLAGGKDVFLKKSLCIFCTLQEVLYMRQ